MYTEKQVVDFTNWVSDMIHEGLLFNHCRAKCWTLEELRNKKGKVGSYTSAQLFQYWLSENYLKA